LDQRLFFLTAQFATIVAIAHRQTMFVDGITTIFKKYKSGKNKSREPELAEAEEGKNIRPSSYPLVVHTCMDKTRQ
jgi:hypothetical protein